MTEYRLTWEYLWHPQKKWVRGRRETTVKDEIVMQRNFSLRHPDEFRNIKLFTREVTEWREVRDEDLPA